MDFVALPFSSLCSLREFKVNGIDAMDDDFVDQFRP